MYESSTIDFCQPFRKRFYCAETIESISKCHLVSSVSLVLMPLGRRTLTCPRVFGWEHVGAGEDHGEMERWDPHHAHIGLCLKGPLRREGRPFVIFFSSST